MQNRSAELQCITVLDLCFIKVSASHSLERVQNCNAKPQCETAVQNSSAKLQCKTALRDSNNQWEDKLILSTAHERCINQNCFAMVCRMSVSGI